MKAKDLMIGDWLCATDGDGNKHLCRVASIEYDRTNDRDDYTIDFNGTGYSPEWPDVLFDCEPIPLTPEILEKNGFEKRKDGQWVIEKKRIVGCCGQTCGNTNPMVYVIWVDKGYMGVVNYHPEATITKVGSYVHELQQCIRLCGIDKEITL